MGQEPPKTKASGRRGRPQGSKNRNRREVELSPSLRFIQEQIKRVLEQIGDAFKVVYFMFDGELGHNDAMQMVRQLGLHLISKLRYNSALYFPYDGPYCGRGPRRKYGQKVDYRHIPSTYLQSTSIDKEIKTQMYQMVLWHKKFAEMLNVVVIVKTHLKTHKIAHVVFFSSDLTLGYDLLIDYYGLRFQIEIVYEWRVRQVQVTAKQDNMSAGLGAQVGLDEDDDIQRWRELLVEQLCLIQAGLDGKCSQGVVN